MGFPPEPRPRSFAESAIMREGFSKGEKKDQLFLLSASTAGPWGAL